MKKSLLALSILIGLICFSAQAQEAIAPAEGVVHYAVPKIKSQPQMKKLEAAEDTLYDGAEIKPLPGQLSDSEKLAEDSSDLEYVANMTKLPNLPCSDAKLLQEVSEFIYNNVRHRETHSVLEQRSRTLLVKNLHAFEEINEKDLADNFEANAALMYLKVNERRDIHRICASRNNRYGDFKNIYLIIYPYINYYKVVVTNLITLPENMEKATFIHNW